MEDFDAWEAGHDSEIALGPVASVSCTAVVAICGNLSDERDMPVMFPGHDSLPSHFPPWLPPRWASCTCHDVLPDLSCCL